MVSGVRNKCISRREEAIGDKIHFGKSFHLLSLWRGTKPLSGMECPHLRGSFLTFSLDGNGENGWRLLFLWHPGIASELLGN
jgi:hypothetical protein